jgi:hypothetical protein
MAEAKPVRLAVAVFAMAFLVLIVLVARSPNRFLYDEHFFAAYPPLLHQYGLTPEFLRHLPGSPGPLCGFFQLAFEPFTGLRPVGMRLVNVLILLSTIVTLAFWNRDRSGFHRWAVAGSVLVVPMAWVIGGLALSEISAVFFVTTSLCLELEALRRFGEGRPYQMWFAASAVCLGIASWGRQPCVLLCGVPVITAIIDTRLIRSAVMFVVIVCAMFVPLVVIWKGMVPPIEQHVQEHGISLAHGVLSFGYVGICLLLLAPRFRGFSIKMIVGLVVLIAIANLALRIVVRGPMNSTAARYLSPPALTIYDWLGGTVILCFGVISLVAILRLAWENRTDLQRFSVCTGLLIIAASPLFISYQYSTRYTAMALPYMVLTARPLQGWSIDRAATALLGCVLGMLSLWSYVSVRTTPVVGAFTPGSNKVQLTLRSSDRLRDNTLTYRGGVLTPVTCLLAWAIPDER